MSTLRALSLWQPWASLMAIGAKRVETRPRGYSHRGPLAIAATAGIPAEYREGCAALVQRTPFRSHLEAHGWTRLEDMPRGSIVAVVWVDAEHKITGDLSRAAIAETYGTDELRFGNFADGRLAIHTDVMELMRLPEPVPCKGSQGLWTVPAGVLGQIAAQLRHLPQFRRYRDAFGAFAFDNSGPLVTPEQETPAPPAPPAPPATPPPSTN